MTLYLPPYSCTRVSSGYLPRNVIAELQIQLHYIIVKLPSKKIVSIYTPIIRVRNIPINIWFCQHLTFLQSGMNFCYDVFSLQFKKF